MRKRLFLAIPIPDSYRSVLAGLKSDNDSIRWVLPENYHITISFFGYVEEEYISKITSVLENTIKEAVPFRITFDKITFAPLNKTPRMIWVLFKQNLHFRNLVTAVENNVQIPDRQKALRKLHSPLPHITLARFKTFEKIKAMKFDEITLPELHVSSFSLFESQLSPKGPKYSVLQEFSL